MLTVDDDAVVRAHLRQLLWDGATPATAEVAAKLRGLVRDRIVTPESTGAVVQTVYEFAGVRVLARLLDLLRAGRGKRTWDWLSHLGAAEVERAMPFIMEFDLVGRIAFRELKCCPQPDGQPLDPELHILATAARFPAFEAEPYDLPAALPAFHWPTVVLSGDRDLRTPRPIAERIAALIPGAILLPLKGQGHSALDTHQKAALHVLRALRDGEEQRLLGQRAAIDALPRRGLSRLLSPIIRIRLLVEGLLPSRPLASETDRGDAIVGV
jgi:pimeloyl-ACP methyl ester carboxylesterase